MSFHAPQHIENIGESVFWDSALIAYLCIMLFLIFWEKKS